MIQCNTLNPISECRMSLPGIRNIMLIPYGDISNYTYTDDNLSYVTGYDLISLPVELQANKESVFNAELLNGQANEFQHTLSALIPVMEESKRTEFERIINMDLTIIFTDKNGRCWLMGQDRPVRASSYSFGTGKSGGENVYNISFQSTSKYQIRQVSCYDGQCFASFAGTEYRQSAFLIPDASLIDFSLGTLLTITGDADVFTYNLTAAMIPTDWDTSSSQRLADSIQLNNLIGNPSSGQVSQLIYDSGTDEAVIVFSSSDTLYANLNIGIESGFAVSQSIELNLVLTLAAPLDAAATVTVTDSDLNVVYSGAPNDFLGSSYDGVSGYVNNATINVTELYSAGTTFTAEIEGLDCGTQTYTFIYEPSYVCSETSVSNELLAGRSYSLKSIRHSGTTPYFRSITYYFDGYMFSLYKDEADWHSSPALLKTDVEAALAANPLLDMTDLLITTTGTGITINFKSSSDSFDCWMLNEGNDAGGSTSHLKTVGTQSNLLHITTIAPDSSITIEDNIGNTAEGTYNNAPTSSTFESETNDTITGTINDYAINADQYVEDNEFDVIVDNIVCPDDTTSFIPGGFFSNYDSFTDGQYQLWRIDLKAAASQSFTQLELTYTTAGTITSYFPSVSYDSGYDEFSTSLATDLISGAKLLGIYSNEPLQYIYLELFIPITDTLTAIDINTTGQVIDLLVDEAAERYAISPYMHPAVYAQYTFHTIDPFTPLVSINSPLLEVLNVTGERVDDEEFIIQLDYDGTDISLTIANNNIFTGSYELEFFDVNPLVGTPSPLVSYNYAQPTIGASINFTADLAAVTAVPSDVEWVKVTIDTGWTEVYEFNPTAAMLVSLGKSCPNRIAWGRHYEFIKVGTFPLTYEITSTEHPTNFNLNDLSSGDMRLHIQAEDLFAQDMTFDTMIGGVDYTNIPYTTNDPTGYADGLYIKPENSTSYEYIDTISTFSTGTNEIVFKNPVLHIPADKVVARANIYSWNDLSDDARAVTSSVTYAPALREVDFTRHNRAAFMSSSELLDVDTTSMLTLNDWELFIVLRVNALDSSDVVYDWQADTRNAYIQASISGTDAVLEWKDDLGTSTSVNIGGFPFDPYSFNVIHYKVSKDPGTGDITASIDINKGLSVASTIPSPGVIAGTIVTQLLGAWYDGASYKDGFGGDVLEVLMFDSLSPTDVDNVSDYLLTKYNITAI